MSARGCGLRSATLRGQLCRVFAAVRYGLGSIGIVVPTGAHRMRLLREVFLAGIDARVLFEGVQMLHGSGRQGLGDAVCETLSREMASHSDEGRARQCLKHVLISSSCSLRRESSTSDLSDASSSSSRAFGVDAKQGAHNPLRSMGPLLLY